MRIAFVLNSLRTGGAEIHTIALAEGLCARGHACTILPLIAGADVSRAQGLISPVVGGNRLQGSRLLARLLDKWAPDLVVAVNERPLICAHLARSLFGGPRRPIVEVFHTSDIRDLRQRTNFAMARPFFLRSDGLVYVSENQRRQWEIRGLSANRVATIQNGIDAVRFSPAHAAQFREPQRQALGYTPADVVIGMSAAFRPEKNHYQALDALQLLRERGMAARLLFIGGGPDQAAIRAKAAAMGIVNSVYFAGRHADVVPFVAAFDIGLLTSTAETFSLAALEIMAMGVPMVMSDVGGASEIINGVNGRLFPASNTEALVSALASFSGPDVRRNAGAAATALVQAQFTHEAMVERYEALFTKIACNEA